jgi:adenosylmethionine-8-amino-7-oxononanoate aminotransferase
MFYRDLFKKHIRIVRGNGVYIYDENGKKYLDASGGSNASITIGHGVEEVIDAMLEQAKKISFVPMHLFSNEPAESLAEQIAEVTPGNFKSTWFVNSGSEAMDNSAKIARQFQVENKKPSKFKIITRWQGFHGNTLGALGFGGHTVRRSKYIPLLKDMPHIPPANCYRCWFNKKYPNCDIDCAIFLERVIRQEGPEHVAAFVAEPIVGATTGATVPAKEYFPIIREICDKYDVVFVVDEVQSGFGRTGKWFSIEHWNVVPDIIAAAKGMSGGYTPIGAVIVCDNIMEVFRENKSNIVGGHTFCANPQSTSTALAVVKYMQSNNLVDKSKVEGKYLIERLRELQEHHPIIGDVRGLGLMVGFELVKDRKTKTPYPLESKICHLITRKAMEKGAIIYPGSGTADGIIGDHILLTPPYIIEKNQTDELISILDSSIKEIEKKFPPLQ